MAIDQKLGRQWRGLIHVVMVVSCLELPNNGPGRREIRLKDESGVVKISVDDRKKVW